jgi:hypothetical protein
MLLMITLFLDVTSYRLVGCYQKFVTNSILKGRKLSRKQTYKDDVITFMVATHHRSLTSGNQFVTTVGRGFIHRSVHNCVLL